VIVHAEDVQQRGFARAGRSHHGDEIAFLNLQVNVAQDVKKLLLCQRIRTFEIFEFDHVKWIADF
jgi:hypothetical protein